jgi:hypothetical protein
MRPGPASSALERPEDETSHDGPRAVVAPKRNDLARLVVPLGVNDREIDALGGQAATASIVPLGVNDREIDALGGQAATTSIVPLGVNDRVGLRLVAARTWAGR